MIGGYIGLLGTLSALIGLIFFLQALRRLSGKIRSAFLWFMVAAANATFYSTLSFIFIIQNRPITDFGWKTIPLLYLLTATPFVISMKKLVSIAVSHSRRKQQ